MKVHDTEVSVACRHLFRRYEARHFPPCLKSFGHDPTILRSELGILASFSRQEPN
jgi:hypothetical protein